MQTERIWARALRAGTLVAVLLVILHCVSCGAEQDNLSETENEKTPVETVERINAKVETLLMCQWEGGIVVRALEFETLGLLPLRWVKI